MAAPTTTNSVTVRKLSSVITGLWTKIKDTFLTKTTYEWNKEIAFGSTGKLCVGKFPMYDTNVTITISSTTNTAYHAVIVIASQNINESRGGTYNIQVFNDPTGSLSSRLSVKYSTGSRNFEVYIDFPGWSKNLIHIQANALRAAPTDIATSVESIPTTDLLSITNPLVSKTATSGGTSTSVVTTGEKYTWNNKQDALTEITDQEVTDLLNSLT